MTTEMIAKRAAPRIAALEGYEARAWVGRSGEARIYIDRRVRKIERISPTYSRDMIALEELGYLRIADGGVIERSSLSLGAADEALRRLIEAMQAALADLRSD